MASVKKNYVYNLIAQLLAIILPVVTTPYVTRVLGNENLGIFNYELSILNYFILFGCMGLNTYAQRETAFCKDDRHKQSVVFFEVMLVRVVTVSVSTVVYWVTIVRTADYPLYYALFGLELLATMVDISWFLQGNENFKSQMVRAIITRLLGLACIFLFVKKETDLYIYILCCSGAILAGNLSLWFSVKKSLDKVSLKELHPLRHIKPALIMFLPQIAVNIYTQLDKTMIGLLTNHNYDEVGYYSQAEKIVKIAMTVVTSLGSIMLSRVTVAISRNEGQQAKEYIRKSFRFLYLLGCPIMVGLAVIAGDMVPWFFGDGYGPVVPCMIALSPLVLLIGTGVIFGNQYMIPTRRMREYTNSVLLGSIINMSFNFLLIPRFGAMGAVGATLLAELSVSTRQYFYLRKDFGISIFLPCVQNLIAALIMGGCVYLVSLQLPPVIWATVVEIAVGTVVYFGVLAVMRDEFFLSNVKRVIRRGR